MAICIDGTLTTASIAVSLTFAGITASLDDGGASAALDYTVSAEGSLQCSPAVASVAYGLTGGMDIGATSAVHASLSAATPVTAHVSAATCSASADFGQRPAATMAGADGVQVTMTPHDTIAFFAFFCPVDYVRACFSAGWNNDLPWDNDAGWSND